SETVMDKHFQHALVLLEQRRFDLAEEKLRQSLMAAPEDGMTHAFLAQCLCERKAWEAATAEARQAIHCEPDLPLAHAALARVPEDAFSHANQGWTLLHEGKPRKALEHFREALRLEPEMEFARLGIVEALKARNLIYGLMLRYFLWMDRLGGTVQWVIILGG